ncbi:MAG TPA: methyltransferase domain-containing protein, partial [Thermoanaerobaculia bacterium]|nr:methyltransferase domain-containing protein [Thermoanaerobaculia bacterium]
QTGSRAGNGLPSAAMFAERIRLLRLDWRLRRLQRRFLAAPSKDESLILDYFQMLRNARGLARLLPGGAAGEERIALHLGCGDHSIERWINVDRFVADHVDLCADVARSLPFASSTVAFIHSEDFLEHLDLEAGRRVLGECFRVLVPGGVMRLLTPDLRALVKRLYLKRSEIDLRWCQNYLGTASPCEALNMHLRMGGEHRFIYDQELLFSLLRAAGFRPRHVRFNRSRYPRLRYLDLRDFNLNLLVEAEKPADR